MDIRLFIKHVLSQNKKALPEFFCQDAIIRWHCTNELFTVEEYIKANCEYPGAWDGEIERIEQAGDTIVVVLRVFSQDRSASFHAVSFIKIRDHLIAEMDEYWADDGKAPKWREAMNIGKPICQVEHDTGA